MDSATGHGRSNIGSVSLSQLSSTWLSQSECDFIRQGCHSHCRTDGRGPTELRHYTIVAGSSAVTNVSSPKQQSSSLFMSALLSSNGSSRLYDTATNGSLIDMLCSVRSELVQPSADDATSEGDLEIKFFSMVESASSDTANMLRNHEMALHKYYVPCVLHAIRQQAPEINESTNNGSVLCVIPGAAVWKLYVDVFILSILPQHNHFADSSVYYLDAVTHCINAALYETVLPSLTIRHDNDDNPTTSTILNNIALDPEHTQPLLRKRTDLQRRLPVVISVHAIPSGSQLRTIKKATTLILDATAEEASVSSFAVHAVIIPSDKNEYLLRAIWTSTTTGSLPMSLFPQCLHLAQTAAPLVYQHYSQQRIEGDGA